MTPDLLPRTYLLLGALAALGLGFAWSSAATEHDVGLIEPVYAEPAEKVEVVELGRGQTFGNLLWNRARLDGNEQRRLLLAFREKANPRRLRTGTEVTLRRRGDDGWLRGIDVALNPDETLRLTRDEIGWRTDVVETPVWTDTVFAAGRIDDVLWNAVLSHPALDDVPVNDRAQILHSLDQVFQWQVDFSRQIRAGDAFRFVFVRRVRPDGSMRSGHIVTAELVNQGETHTAVWFDPNQDGDGTYYDLQGQSVRRAFLRKPLEFRRISSRFSSGRYHPILERWRAHRGVDYAADRGTPIMATGNGVVEHAGRKGGLGIAVVLRHPNGFRTRYGHMSGVASGVRPGARVRQGETIGYVGATGLATGPHLHYEMHRAGRPVDPMAIELPPGDPVPADQEEAWSAQLAEARSLLERLPDPDAVRIADVPGAASSSDGPPAGEGE